MSGFSQDQAGEHLEKIMSLTRAEFNFSFVRLAPDAARIDSDQFQVILEEGSATITVEPLEPVVMGGLLKLPRCRIMIDFSAAPPAVRAEFTRRFDLAFQRGGG